ncbi:MAG: hypothetical protein HY881_24425 [Deltaproteobacteria bacterium]|nr:hypothetical protein [Deltaproteobacteria bacterium]
MTVLPKSVWVRAIALFFLCLCLIGIPSPAPATVSPLLQIPPELSKWESWVLYGMEEKRCPARYNDSEMTACLWPSRLKLTIEDNMGKFEQQWLVFRDVWVPLPGSPDRYPNSVELDGKRAPVLMQSMVPSIRLSRGEHRISGSFSWKELPETLMIPPESGIVTLTVKGRLVEQPAVDSSGRLWIQKRDSNPISENRQDIRIFRLLKDTIPMTAINHLRMDISGQAREIRLNDVLLKDAIPLQLTSALPARIGPDGQVMIQARPGNWVLEIETRFEHPMDRIAAGACAHGEEIWSFESQNHLRMVTVSGAPAIDPGQTGVPPAWKEFPAYLIHPETVIRFEQLRRGDSDPAPDQLRIFRIWWLDFDGNGLTQKDRITGTLSRQWLLAMNPPGILGKVAVDGADQLITAHGPEGRAGVELRQGRLAMDADSRINAPLRQIPVAGWDHGFQSASGELNLPPGWKLFAAGGVDAAPASWVERWSLLDFFLVLVTAMAIARLKSFAWGAVALVTLTLIYHEPGSPRVVWLSLLAATALVRVLPEGWAKKAAVLWNVCSMVVLLTIAIPFSIQEIRQGLYPQLEKIPVHPPQAAGAGSSLNVLSPPPQPEPQQEGLLQKADANLPAAPGKAREEKAARIDQSLLPAQIQSLAQDPQALIQTGPGLPSWKWRSFTLRWNGPVDKDQIFRLWLISPGFNLLLAVIRVILLAVLTAGLCATGSFGNYWRNGITKRFFGRHSALAAMLLFCAAMGFSADVRAEAPPASYPPKELLEELQRRVLKIPDCFPICADIPQMVIQVDPTDLKMLMDVQAAIETAGPLPGGAENWAPDAVQMDEQPLKGLMKDADGHLWALVPQGIHRLVVSGKTARLNAIRIALPLKPRQVTAACNGWSVQGIGPEGQVSAGIQFQRIEKQDPFAASVGASALFPFFHVERVLSLGLTWEIRTTITRKTLTGAPVSLQVPLLAGESVTTADIHVEQEKAMINFDPGTQEINLLSHLDFTEILRLTAPIDMLWTESWVLEASPVWHCDFSGIPVIHQQDSQGQWRPEWRPWPGESIEIRISRPAAIPGPILTMDSAVLKWTPGERLDKAELTIMARTSRGGQHQLELPQHADLQKVSIQGRSQPIRQEGRNVLVPLVPGTQKIALEWQQPLSGPWHYHPPQVSIGAPAVNASISIHVPEHRWILWASGPRLGPAVLFWGYLLIIVLISIGLGKTALAPLKTRHWLLLTLGLTQIHPLMALVIVGWLLALGIRNTTNPRGGWVSYNLSQLLLAGWTAAALSGLYMAIENGLMGIPDMQIAGNQSTSRILNWTQDRIAGFMPDPWIISLPEWVFHGLMLLWSLWLAFALLNWLKWGWQCFARGGAWKKVELRWKRKPAA